MKVIFSKVLSAVITVLFFLTIFQPGIVNAQSTSVAPGVDDITITNNTGAYDIINVEGLAGGDKVIVYNAATDGKVLGSATVSSTKSEATIRIAQLGTAAGSVYISVTSKGESESSRIKVNYLAEVQTDAPDADNIAVTNNSGKPDLVYVTGLYGGETVRVYNSASGGKQLGSATASSAKTEITLKISQLGINAGSIYVTLTNKGELESTRVRAYYSAEAKSDAPDPAYITVTNNAGINDSVVVTYLSLGDVVNVYDAPKGGNLLGSATVPSSKTEVTISISQLSKNAGYVYVTITNLGSRESDRTMVAYPGENSSYAPYAGYITVNNNGGISDTVKVSKLNAGDIVKIYDAAAGGNLLGTGTVPASSTEVTVSVNQLISADGCIYVSVINRGRFESTRTKIAYSAEPKTAPVNTGKVTIANNVGKSDTINVSGLVGGDLIKVYDSASGTTVLGSATVINSKTDGTVTISQLGIGSGYIYISVTSKGKLESDLTKISFPAEAVSDIADLYDITVVNNPAGKSDTVQVTGLAAGDMIKVYDLASDGTVLGSATVASSKTEATVSIPQLGKAAGYIYVSVTSSGKNESARTKVEYPAESTSDPADTDNINVTNNAAGTPDTVEVTDLAPGDVIKVYDSVSGGNLLGNATVPANGTYATVSIPQLGSAAGEVYVSITSSNKLESSRVKVSYSAEDKTAVVDAGNIAVTNNCEIADTVEVTGLNQNDVIKVYNAAKGGNLLGMATVSNYSSYATVTISQLGVSAGSVYVTITGKNKLESDRIKVDYPAEAISTAPGTGSITIINNAGTSDIIKVTGLNTDDTVKVYSSAAGGTLLGSSSVSSGSDATVNITQLGTAAGSVYITVTSKSKSESERTKADYSAEELSFAPSADNIEIVNNVGTSDTIKVAGLSGGDVVNVYDSAKAGNLLGSATVDTYASSVTISVTQLSSTAGSIYVTITTKAKLESSRTKADYAAEAVSTAPTADNITVENNAGISDTINVTGLLAGDVVNVYDSAKVGNLLGSATVSTYDSSVTITVTQLSSTAGNVYVSVTSKNKTESVRTMAAYSAEPKTDAPSADDITIVNNAGIDDTIKVAGLSGGDVVKVYSALSGGTLLGTATASTYDTYATVTATQIGSAAGSVYVTVTKKGCQESSRVKASYSAEPKSGTSDSSNILVFNNAGAPDKVQINGLSGGDVVNVYSSAAGGSPIGTATVSTYDSAVTVTITQLGTTAGKVYVSVKAKGKLESDRTMVAYAAEQKSDPPADGNIIVTNNAVISDAVRVAYLTKGDVVKVYDAASDGNILGMGTVADGEDEITINITQLGTSAGNVYVSVTSVNKLESNRTAASYAAEVTTDAPQADNVKIINNAAIADTITVTFLKPDDVVRVYNKSYGGTLLGSATVLDDKTEATINIDKLDASGGSVYISVTSLGKAESSRTRITYAAEEQSEPLASSNIAVKNNAGMADTITVSFLDPKDVVKVYSSDSTGTVLGTATVSSDSTEVTIKVAQLGSYSGNVYVSVTAYGKLESKRTMVCYAAESTSDAPDINNITIVNNTGKSDTIKVTGLMGNDTVNIYSSSSGGSLLGTGTVPEDGTEVTIKINQLGTSYGNVYITVISPGAFESSRVKAGYSAEN